MKTKSLYFFLPGYLKASIILRHHLKVEHSLAQRQRLQAATAGFRSLRIRVGFRVLVFLGGLGVGG